MTHASERLSYFRLVIAERSVPGPTLVAGFGRMARTAKTAMVMGASGIAERSTGAHRAAYEVFKGHIADGLYVCHRCDVRSCCNHNHLFLGTHLENQQDKARKGRTVIPHCQGESHGHAKLSNEDVIDIRSSRLGTDEFADLYRVSRETVWRIKARRIWKHVS